MSEVLYSNLFSDASLQAYYRFNTGALTTDSKNSNTLTNTNTVGETASGKFGYAADFGASNTNKSLSISSTLGITTWASAFSISLWIKRHSELGSGAQDIFAKEVESTTGGLNWLNYEYNGGTRRLKFSRYDEATTENAYFNINLGTDWHHVVFVYDGASIIPYVNGIAGTSVVSDGTSSGTAYGNVLNLGGIVADGYWSGFMDDVAVFSRALNASEVRTLFTYPTTSAFML